MSRTAGSLRLRDLWSVAGLTPKRCRHFPQEVTELEREVARAHAPRPLPQFRWNTVSPGDKICLPGRLIQICLRGRQNLSPWETKSVSLGDNALYSKNPFRFHKESCCYAARASPEPKPS